AEEHLGAAEAALSGGDAAGAAHALALASVYIDSHLWDTEFPPAAREGARARQGTLGARLKALRAVAERGPLVEAARAALAPARAARVRSPAAFAAAAAPAAACAAPPPPGADAEWSGPAGSLAELAAECRKLAEEAAAGEAQAAAAAAARDRAFRAALRGDRLAIYERYGAPTDPDAPEIAARARTWTYVGAEWVGPRGETRLVLTFRGDKLVGRRRIQQAR